MRLETIICDMTIYGKSDGITDIAHTESPSLTKPAASFENTVRITAAAQRGINAMILTAFFKVFSVVILFVSPHRIYMKKSIL